MREPSWLKAIWPPAFVLMVVAAMAMACGVRTGGTRRCYCKDVDTCQTKQGVNDE